MSPSLFATGILPGPCTLSFGPTYFGQSVASALKAVKAEEQIANAIDKIKHRPTMTILHLVTAVLARISSFHKNKADFSAYDITTDLRKKVAEYAYDIVDVRKDHFGGAFLSVIKHDAVRDIIEELFSLKLIPDYVVTPHYNSQKDVSYKLYVFTSDDAPAAPVASAPAPLPATVATDPANDAAGLTQVVAAVAPVLAPAAPLSPAPALASPDSAMWAKVDHYVATKRSLLEYPTIKQIQSRLKGFAVTCQQIFDYLKQRNVTIIDLTGNVSQAEVR